MSAQANCPGCGAAIQFSAGSAIVKICAYCRSVVARGDRALEDLGKVAALVETDSPLMVGTTGKFEGVSFVLTGRAQLAHPMGGVWDEWYASFSDGRWGWLAEAQGRFYISFQQPNHVGDQLPAFQQLEVGSTLRLGPRETALVVAEVGEARTLAAEGEIPYRLVPNHAHRFADLSGKDQTFATLGYEQDGEAPTVYLGKQVTLDDLGIPPNARRRPARQVTALHLNCPNCGGGLELRAPDQSERVVCPSCRSLLDARDGNLRFLQVLTMSDAQPAIPLGIKGRLANCEWTVIGFVERFVTEEGVNYFWDEYLLYEPREGFRWLVQSNGHWSFVEPVPVGEIECHARTATYDGRKFKLFQRGEATVSCVLGELYWRVTLGEKALTADFIAPPFMLSRERSVSEASEEVNWSLGRYLTPAEVKQAFGVARLPAPQGVGPIQPFPLDTRIYHVWGQLMLVLLVLAFVIYTYNGMFRYRKLFERDFTLAATSPDNGQVFFNESSQPLRLSGWGNIEIDASAPVNNSWIAIEGDLIDEETGLVQPFLIPIEYYHGVEGGESWSEGSQHGTAMLSRLPEGAYSLRLEVVGEAGKNAGLIVRVKAYQGVMRWLHFFAAAFLISLPALVVGIYHLSFEQQRWKDSEFGTKIEFGSSDD
jgi:Zn-finger nucleic acid-binding protein